MEPDDFLDEDEMLDDDVEEYETPENDEGGVYF